MAVADVLIPLALDTAYSYAVPDGLALREGDVVQVPLGPRETVGRRLEACATGAGAQLQARDRRGIDAPPLSPGAAQAPRLDRLVHARAERLGAGAWP